VSHSLPTRLVCFACGYEPPLDDPYPFRCPNAHRDDDQDHLLGRWLEVGAIDLPSPARSLFLEQNSRPFRRFRRLLHSYQVARAAWLTDGDFLELEEELDRKVAEVDGGGFRQTPFEPQPKLAAALGLDGVELWIKDETGNVSGSHKGRHLMGVLLWLEVMERIHRPADGAGAPERPPLAISSCGNAALAAAVLARAADRRLQVFVPPSAEAEVLRRIEALGARPTTCPRSGEALGDPSYLAFREAVEEGALPFSCQGNENGLVIEGGATLAWEMAVEMARRELSLDRLIVQVGGGALASSCLRGLQEARDLGLILTLPRVHALQTEAVHPLARAYERLVDWILDRHRLTEGGAPVPDEPEERADFLARSVSPALLMQGLRQAALHRSRFMTPWERVGESVASSILDDETYDWLAVIRGMLETGGYPLVVSEGQLAAAHRMARDHTASPVCASGSSGLAGLLELRRRERLNSAERVGVLFTGRERGPSINK
jgi:threonine synthase